MTKQSTTSLIAVDMLFGDGQLQKIAERRGRPHRRSTVIWVSTITQIDRC